MMAIIKRWFWLILLVTVLFLLMYFGANKYLTFDFLKQHRQLLLSWTENHYIVTAVCYMVIYAIAVAVSFPGASYLTIIGGFLFGVYLGTIYVVISATVGSLGLFLAVRNAMVPFKSIDKKNWLSKMQDGFQENEIRYLFFLRILPIFPFWAVNIAAAVFNVRIMTFTVVTFIGIIPGTLIYVLLGGGLSRLFAANKLPNMSIIFQPYFIIPLIALALLSVLPICYKKFKPKQGLS